MSVSAQKIRAILKRANFASAYRYSSGKLQGAGRLVNAYRWQAGYRVVEDEGVIKVLHQMDFSKAETEREMALRYLASLEQQGIKCFLNGRNEIVIVGIA